VASLRNALLTAAILFYASRAYANESPMAVSICDLLRNPENYDHKLILVTGSVSRGFEDFTLTAEGCGLEQASVWLEFGGKVGSQTVYCCGETNSQGKRKQSFKVDEIETFLVMDKTFKRFQMITNKGQSGSAKTTIIGRFFAGTKHVSSNGAHWTGFGHFGMYSLLVIQQVTHVEAK
jgi:hypothetical protein